MLLPIIILGFIVVTVSISLSFRQILHLYRNQVAKITSTFPDIHDRSTNVVTDSPPEVWYLPHVISEVNSSSVYRLVAQYNAVWVIKIAQQWLVLLSNAQLSDLDSGLIPFPDLISKLNVSAGTFAEEKFPAFDQQDLVLARLTLAEQDLFKIEYLPLEISTQPSELLLHPEAQQLLHTTYAAVPKTMPPQLASQHMHTTSIVRRIAETKDMASPARSDTTP